MRVGKSTVLLLVMLFFIVALFAQRPSQKQLTLADDYFKKGQFEKALIIYKKLHEKKPYSYNYIYKLVETYQQLEKYSEVKDLLQKRIENNRMPMMLVELGYNYQLMDSIVKAETYFNAI